MLTRPPTLLAQAQPATAPINEVNQVEEVAYSLLSLHHEMGAAGWVTVLAALFAGILAGKLASTLLMTLARRAENRSWRLRATALRAAAGPANLALITCGLGIALVPIRLAETTSPRVDTFAGDVVELLYIIAIGWFLYNLVDLIDVALRHLTSKTDSKLDDQLVPLVRKTLRIFLVIVFTLFIAENVFGANIGAWLAGLGIAGLAVSLAAQDSIKNFFGSVTIFMDRPFALGEVITFAGHTGSVEEIGFRSTKVRRLDGQLVTVPNSKIVDSEVQNVSRRPNILRRFDLTITYDTPPEKVDRAVAIVKEILAAPDIAAAFDLEKLPPRVYFGNLGSASLDIQVWYWFHPASDWWGYMAHTEKVNQQLLRAFAVEGIDFAFPTQTVYVAGDPRRPLVMPPPDPRGG